MLHFSYHVHTLISIILMCSVSITGNCNQCVVFWYIWWWKTQFCTIMSKWSGGWLHDVLYFSWVVPMYFTNKLWQHSSFIINDPMHRWSITSTIHHIDDPSRRRSIASTIHHINYPLSSKVHWMFSFYVYSTDVINCPMCGGLVKFSSIGCLLHCSTDYW